MDTDGNHVAYAMVDYPGDFRDVETWQVSVDRHGFLALDAAPEDYPRVWILEEADAPDSGD